jgi:hypothetical protein
MVEFNKSRNQYELAGTATNTGLKPDDWILQAMVMWNLTRLQLGWGRERMLQQLTVWSNERKPSESNLPKIFKNEIERLQSTDMTSGRANDDAETGSESRKKPKSGKKMLGKGLSHHDNFDTFCKFYAYTEDFEEDQQRWRRRSQTQNNWVHVLGEQAAVQWALQAQASDPDLAKLAAVFVRLQNQESDQPMVIPKVLQEQAEKAAEEGRSFSRLAFRALHKQSD